MVQIEAGLDESLEGEKRDRRLRHRICFLFDTGSLCLLAIFALHLLPVLIESRPLQADWQGIFVATVVDHAPEAFLGFVLLHLAVLINPRKQPLRQRLRLVRHFAVFATVGFLLLIPLQAVSSASQMRTLKTDQMDFLAQTQRLTELRQFIQQTNSAIGIEQRLRAMSEPGLTSEQRSMNLAELRSSLLRSNQDQQAVLARLLQAGSGNFAPLTLMISRMGLALGWAFAFGAGAVPFGARSTMLERVLRR